MKLEEEGLACEPPACRARSQCSNPSGRENVLNQSPSLKVTLSASLLLSPSVVSPSHILHLQFYQPFAPAFLSWIWLRPFVSDSFILAMIAFSAHLSLSLLFSCLSLDIDPHSLPPFFLGHHASFQLKATYGSICL